MSLTRQNTTRITTGLLFGLVLASIDQTIVSTAMPTIAQDLGGLHLYSWVFAVYMLASTTTMPIYGKLADLFGRRHMYLIGLTIFLVGSLLCGIATTMLELVLYRGVQGLGAGALMPLSMTIAADIFPPERRGKFMGLFGTVFAISSIFGPTLGGILVDYVHWRWIFFINLPLGIAGIFFIRTGLSDNQTGEGRRSIDWLGALTLTSAILTILLGLVLGDSTQQASNYIITLFAIGALLLGAFIFIESRAEEPIIPLHLFRIRAISFGNIIGFFMSAAMFGAIAYIPLYVQGVIGVSPAIAGYILTPLMLSTVVTSTLSGKLMQRFSYRTILIGSLITMLIGFCLLSSMDVQTSITTVLVYMIITGLGMGAIYPTIGTAAAGAVGWNDRGVATSSSQFFRSIGGTMGVSILGSMLTNRMNAGLVNLQRELPATTDVVLTQLTNPQTLLDQHIRSSLQQDALLHLQRVFSLALHDIFIVAVFFIGLALMASCLFGRARMIQPTKRS
ncbi:MDR family MFS transporter [Paenibacillus guangzhouensis]|uniref:MDR family MFS transporter n=1 Tax=Paenibacillus guangzhouensis TaxID=1473112 RepID=UPI0012673B0F|nr:MDR family MFS transporter [Paenibacillus guangzhouensis]